MPLKMFQEKVQHPLAQVKYVIAIAAGKGGVGKSSVTVNLALALQKVGRRVGILDADIYGPSVRRMLREEKLPIQQGKQIIPAMCRGIPMISMAYFRQENEAAVVRAPIANSIISQFLNSVEWGVLDFLLIDFPPGTGDIQLTLAQQSNLSGAIMVTTPQEVALQDVRKAMHLFEQVKVPILGVIENMSYFVNPETKERSYIFGRGGGKKIAEEKNVPLLGTIPLDSAISECGDTGESIFSHENGVESAKIYSDIAQKFEKRLVDDQEGLEKPFSILIQSIQKVDDRTFSIQWNDGTVGNYRLSDLQKNCPCAGCRDEFTGEILIDDRDVDVNVGFSSISNVGRYALRIQFTSGCSSGIYEYESLYNLARGKS